MSYCCIISVIHHYSKVLPWGIASKMKPSSRKKIHQQPQYNYRIKGWWWNLIMIWPGSEWKLGEQKGWRENKRKIPKVLLSEGWVSKGKISSPFRATTLNCIQAELNSTGSHRREQKLGTGHKGPALNGTNPSWQIQHCLSPSWAGIHRQRDGVGLDLGRERASKKIPHSGVAGSRSQGSAVLRMWQCQEEPTPSFPHSCQSCQWSNFFILKQGMSGMSKCLGWAPGSRREGGF